MAKTDYNEFAELALNEISDNGGDCSLRKNTGALIDVTQPWLGSEDTEVGYPSKGILLPLSMREQSLYPELTVTKDNRKFLMEAIELTAVPKIGDKVLYEDEYWQIENVKQLKPVSVVVMYTLIVSQ